MEATLTGRWAVERCLGELELHLPTSKWWTNDLFRMSVCLSKSCEQQEERRRVVRAGSRLKRMAKFVDGWSVDLSGER
jgi:hypothetical protein